MNSSKVCKRIDMFKENPMLLAKFLHSQASPYDNKKDLSAWLDYADNILQNHSIFTIAKEIPQTVKCYDCPLAKKCTCEDYNDEICKCYFIEWLIEPVIVLACGNKSIEVCTDGFDYNKIYSYQKDDTLQDPEEYPTVEQLIFSWALLNEFLDAYDLLEAYEDDEEWRQSLNEVAGKAFKIYDLKYGESNG